MCQVVLKKHRWPNSLTQSIPFCCGWPVDKKARQPVGMVLTDLVAQTCQWSQWKRLASLCPLKTGIRLKNKGLISLTTFLPQFKIVWYGCHNMIDYEILHMPEKHGCPSMCKIWQLSFYQKLDEWKMKFPISLNYDGMIISEMSPSPVSLLPDSNHGRVFSITMISWY